MDLWSSAKKCDSGLMFLARLPLLSAITGEIEAHRESLEDDIRRKKKAKPKAKARKTPEQKAAEAYEHNYQQVYSKVKGIKTLFPAAYAELRGHYAFDEILARTYKITDFPKCMSGIRVAFDKLPAAIREPVLPPVEPSEKKYKANCDDDEFVAGRSSEEIIVNCGLRSQITNKQEELTQWLVAHEGEMKRGLLAAIVSHYSRHCESWAIDLNLEVGEHPSIPLVMKAEDLDGLIRLNRIYLASARCAMGHVIDCAWLDEEHSTLGVLVVDHKEFEVGGDELAMVQ